MLSDDELIREATSTIIPAEQRHPDNPVLEMLEELSERLANADEYADELQSEIDELVLKVSTLEHHHGSGSRSQSQSRCQEMADGP